MNRLSLILLLCTVFVSIKTHAQTNILSTSPVAEQVMLSNYNPAIYMPSTVINYHHQIVCEINEDISADTLKAYLEKLGTFHTRNSGSDTLSPDTGIGVARRWIYSEFQKISADNENRLLPSYLQFDQVICGMGQHRNVFAVLPGADTANKSIIIIEAHMDTRCENNCDITCKAHGIDDNGSGTALVIELARVMSKYSFDHTIVFMTVMGEEQGLLGANAFSQYAVDNGIQIKAVQNNDVVGGVICGYTSSPPSCPGVNEIDSTRVRLFSHGSIATASRGYARTVKLYYQEKLLSNVSVPMTIDMYNQEDRTGRGGDHIPFRQDGFPAMRFNAAHEHGDGSGTLPDRCHTSTDIIGVDTDNDQVIDSFFVDFNYLARNAVINGVCVTLCALGPQRPAFTVTDDPSGIIVEIDPPLLHSEYRVGIRKVTSTLEYDSIYRFDGTSFLIPGQIAGTNYYIGVAAIDSNGIMSPFSKENGIVQSDANTSPAAPDPFDYNIDCYALAIDELNVQIMNNMVELMQSKPNPFTHSTVIGVKVNKEIKYTEAYINIIDLLGRHISKLDIKLKVGTNEVLYSHEAPSSGIYSYSLVIDGAVHKTRRMVISR